MRRGLLAAAAAAALAATGCGADKAPLAKEEEEVTAAEPAPAGTPAATATATPTPARTPTPTATPAPTPTPTPDEVEVFFLVEEGGFVPAEARVPAGTPLLVQIGNRTRRTLQVSLVREANGKEIVSGEQPPSANAGSFEIPRLRPGRHRISAAGVGSAAIVAEARPGS